MSTEDRRAQLLKMLRDYTRIPAHHLCTRLGGISVRTFYRDIQLLRARGYRIRSRSGRGGGFWIAPDCKPFPIQLEPAELREVVLALVRSAHQGALVQLPTVSTLLRRLLATLPKQREQALGLLFSALPEQRHRVVSKPVLESLEDAHRLDTWVGVTSYRGNVRSRHLLEPLPLQLLDGRWILCGRTEDGRRHQIALDRTWALGVSPTALIRAQRRDWRVGGWGFG